MTDAELVAALKEGQGGAFELIWARYARHVNRFLAGALGGGRHDVEDLTQEVFLRLFTARRRIQKPESLRSFVMSIADNVLKTQLRDARIRRCVSLTATGEIPEVANAPALDEAARCAAERLRRCHDILSGVRNEARVAFMWRYFDEMSVREVAERLGISPSTVKRLNARVLRKVCARTASKVEDILPADGRRRPKRHVGRAPGYSEPEGVRRFALTAASST